MSDRSTGPDGLCLVTGGPGPATVHRKVAIPAWRGRGPGSHRAEEGRGCEWGARPQGVGVCVLVCVVCSVCMSVMCVWCVGVWHVCCVCVVCSVWHVDVCGVWMCVVHVDVCVVCGWVWCVGVWHVWCVYVVCVPVVERGVWAGTQHWRGRASGGRFRSGAQTQRCQQRWHRWCLMKGIWVPNAPGA